MAFYLVITKIITNFASDKRKKETLIIQPYRITDKRNDMTDNMTADIKFNRIVAKLNFKYSDRNDLKQAIEKSLLSETALIVANNRQMINSILNPNGDLEIQRAVVGEAIAFLNDDSAISVRMIQHNVYGISKFVYEIRTTCI